jgi:transposase, IS6 family
MPRVINVDKNPAYPRAVAELQADGTISRRCRLRQRKYLNNVGTRSSECKTPNMARQRLRFAADSMPHLERNRDDGHVEERQGNVVGQAKFISSLFGIAA